MRQRIFLASIFETFLRIRRENEMLLMVQRVYGNVCPSDFGIRFCFSYSVTESCPHGPVPSCDSIRPCDHPPPETEFVKQNRQPKGNKSFDKHTWQRERGIQKPADGDERVTLVVWEALRRASSWNLGQIIYFKQISPLCGILHLVRQCISQPFRSPVCDTPLFFFALIFISSISWYIST